MREVGSSGFAVGFGVFTKKNWGGRREEGGRRNEGDGGCRWSFREEELVREERENKNVREGGNGRGRGRGKLIWPHDLSFVWRVVPKTLCFTIVYYASFSFKNMYILELRI